MSVQVRQVLPRALVLVFVLFAVAAARAQEPAFTPARIVRALPPEAPPMQPNQEVEVVLLLEVDELGHVAAVTVEQSGGAAFDQPAIAAARQFVLAPATLGGKPVSCAVEYRTHFVGPEAEERVTVTEPGRRGALFGQITSRGDRIAQAHVKVILDENARSTSTDEHGRFVIEGIAPGKHVVHLRGTDIVASEETVVIDPVLPTELNPFVDAKPRYVARVRGRLVLSDPIEQTISVEEIRHIAGTQGDTLKAVQNLPGIARPPFNGGLIAVWGSPPGDTRVYADGVYIPTLYHFGGVRSTINASIVSNLTLFPGGYDVQHGRGLGGAVEIETREPRHDGFHGFAQLDLADVSGMVETGIGKRLSVAAGFRISILEFFLPYFLNRVTEFNPKYWDYQFKLHYQVTSRDTLDLFVFGSDDTLDVGLVDVMAGPYQQYHQNTGFHRGLIRYQHRFANGATLCSRLPWAGISPTASRPTSAMASTRTTTPSGATACARSIAGPSDASSSSRAGSTTRARATRSTRDRTRWDSIAKATPATSSAIPRPIRRRAC
jgi:TonB family protein